MVGIQQIPTSDIDANATQHRHNFDEESLGKLAASILEQGVLQNLVVRPHPRQRHRFEIIAGERRFRAAKLAKVATVPCRVVLATDAEAYRMAVVGNVQRQDINVIEEADAYATMRGTYDMTVESIAETTGKSVQYVRDKLQLCSLGKGVRALVISGSLGPGAAWFIAQVEDPEEQMKVALHAVRNGLTQHEVGHLVRIMRNPGMVGGSQDQDALFTVRVLSEEEQKSRVRFLAALDKVSDLLATTWDERLQRVSAKLLTNAVELDLGKVRNLKQWFGQVEQALAKELERRRLTSLVSGRGGDGGFREA